MKVVALLSALALCAAYVVWLWIPSNPGHAKWFPPGAPAAARPLRPRAECARRDSLRRALFGDLHVHTGYSMDARSRDVTLTPDDAYAFARGEEVRLVSSGGAATRTLRIDRPLDFAAVTDHAEWMGEVRLCEQPDLGRYDSSACRMFRGEKTNWLARILGLERYARIIGLIGLEGREPGLCGLAGALCRAGLASVWNETQAATERWYDRTDACSFSTLHGFEYSASPDRSSVHRNVLFRNEIVPELPISWIDAPTEMELWRGLEATCLSTESGCDVLAIPHNPNLSNGRMFTVADTDRVPVERRRLARLRARMEPVVEIIQVKGDSECRAGMYGVVGDPDELCGFEKVRAIRGDPPADCQGGTGAGALSGRGCVSRLDFTRYALIDGLRHWSELGVNPFAFGVIGSTDTHNATPGAVSEYDWPGSTGSNDDSIGERLSLSPRDILARNPGGLAGVWAEENSRDAIFEALRRRETFATSGPRIRPRFFGGWDYPSDICIRSERVAVGYQSGVAMGQVLPPRLPDAVQPIFFVDALRDPGTAEHPGGLLQRVQIVKGWVGDDGRLHQAVYDVAGSAENGSGVDLDTCRPYGEGNDELCGFWRDPAFDQTRAAVYYARILENPSCRWSWRQCLSLPSAQRPEGCDDPRVPRSIQERAWTSPIWYLPANG